MKIPYKNPSELVEKVITDLKLELKPEEIDQLRGDMLTLYAVRIYSLMKRFSPDQKVPIDDEEKFLMVVASIPQLEAELKVEAAMFYEEMMQTYEAVDAYIDKKS